MSKSIKFTFWCHFILVLLAHIFVPIMVAAAIALIFSWQQGFLISGLLIGLTFCTLIWGVNHITNPDSWCWLTDLEQHYRRIVNQNICSKNFLPRFYRKCRQILKRDFWSIPE